MVGHTPEWMKTPVKLAVLRKYEAELQSNGRRILTNRVDEITVRCWGILFSSSGRETRLSCSIWSGRAWDVYGGSALG